MRKPNKKVHLLYKWREELGEDCFHPHNGYMHCSLCNVLVSANRRAQLVHHLYTPRHLGTSGKKKALQTKEETPLRTSTPINAESENKDVVDTENIVDTENLVDKEICDFRTYKRFDVELIAALSAAKIPLSVLNNGQFRTFLNKYTHEPIPDESFMRWRYNV